MWEVDGKFITTSDSNDSTMNGNKVVFKVCQGPIFRCKRLEVFREPGSILLGYLMNLLGPWLIPMGVT
jgi:hypothetical protein